jgi:GNAT superfamily N-acetyltransferase
MEKYRLIRSSFPRSWMRKLPVLVFPSDCIRVDGRLAAICTTLGNRIILLCVAKEFRRRGFASILIKRSRGTTTDTYVGNEGALELWLKNCFTAKGTKCTLFGRKHILVRKGANNPTNMTRSTSRSIPVKPKATSRKGVLTSTGRRRRA